MRLAILALLLWMPGLVWAQEPTTPSLVDEEEIDDLFAEGSEEAQGQEPVGELDQPAEETDPLAETFGEEPEEDLEYIDDLLESDIGMLESGISYDDGGRRDPFRSLLQVSNERPELRGPRPEGVPGLAIDEITVTGIWITPDGPVAQVQAADRAKSFLIRPGDQLYDGDVVRITYERYGTSTVVFKQILDDPTATKPFREVVRRLEP
jgi:hypothetical protein